MDIIQRKEFINDKWLIWAKYDDFSSMILEFATEPIEEDVQTEIDKIKASQEIENGTTN